MTLLRGVKGFCLKGVSCIQGGQGGQEMHVSSCHAAVFFQENLEKMKPAWATAVEQALKKDYLPSRWTGPYFWQCVPSFFGNCVSEILWRKVFIETETKTFILTFMKFHEGWKLLDILHVSHVLPCGLLMYHECSN